MTCEVASCTMCEGGEGVMTGAPAGDVASCSQPALWLLLINTLLCLLPPPPRASARVTRTSGAP